MTVYVVLTTIGNSHESEDTIECVLTEYHEAVFVKDKIKDKWARIAKEPVNEHLSLPNRAVAFHTKHRAELYVGTRIVPYELDRKPLNL